MILDAVGLQVVGGLIRLALHGHPANTTRVRAAEVQPVIQRRVESVHRSTSTEVVTVARQKLRVFKSDGTPLKRIAPPEGYNFRSGD